MAVDLTVGAAASRLAPALARLASYLRLAGAYVRLNWNAQLEYRGAFAWQVGAMFVNDGMWVTFWVVFFHRFPVLRGWRVQDVVTLWSVAAAGFGLAYAFCGNSLRLGQLIAQGQLDVWMLYPRTLLSHLLLGRMIATAWGDALFGYVIYLALIRPDIPHLLLFVALTLSVGTLLVGFSVMAGSLVFFLGSGGALSEQWHNAMLTFSTYPATLFDGWVRVLLYTLLPAAFVTYLPVESLRRLSLLDGALAAGGSLTITMIGILVFSHGLRRYESGNLMEMRG